MTMKKPRLARKPCAIGWRWSSRRMDLLNLWPGHDDLCSNYVDPKKSLIFHSENGVIGYGPLATPEERRPALVNAGGQNVTPVSGMAIVHHADSFALIRKGMVDVTVMAPMRWPKTVISPIGASPTVKAAASVGDGLSGLCQASVHRVGAYYPRGKPRLLKRCTLPITAPGVVKLVATDWAV